MRLAGKRALVTAAAQGIGRATAEAFAREGATVVATDIDVSNLRDVPGLDIRRLDVLDPASIQALAADLGAIDILLNCAGTVQNGTILECDERSWQVSFDLNVTAMFHTIKAFLPAMLESGGGSIVNIASVASSVKGLPSRFAYGASKAAVIGLTKSVAVDYVAGGIRCNAICPGTVETPSLLERVASLARDKGISDQAAMELFQGRQLMGRLGTASEIASMAVYLASDESRFVTGTAMLIDGGLAI